MPRLASPPHNVTRGLGPLLIGVLLNTMLYGILIVQAFLYYSRYTSDRPWFRYPVLYLFIVETANWTTKYRADDNPAKPQALSISPFMLRLDAILTVAISLPVQLFIAWRIRVLTHSSIMPVIIVILALVAFGGRLTMTTMVSLHPDFASFYRLRPAAITWLVSSATCDITLTVSLVFSVWTRKSNVMNVITESTDSYVVKISKANVVSTNNYLNKLIRLTVQTGVITATAALLDMILVLAVPDHT
ncbi:hypothetical protein DFH08DRAFT_950950 [Mycena albidolilacea]|uniref:Uncharacterized protein n=1 Tax=Mycena albidolilacea TaxID=1033008 RepID=A0AAD7ALZ5_9AGAR|nr:hypothetical protein DFH08DRAFT_950950 [Mycena albidolilacea]